MKLNIEKLMTTPLGHIYKQKSMFYIHSINDVYGLNCRQHTSFIE